MLQKYYKQVKKILQFKKTIDKLNKKLDTNVNKSKGENREVF